jgi:RNA polymerase sigma-70 factor (ECF subfamily)
MNRIEQSSRRSNVACHCNDSDKGPRLKSTPEDEHKFLKLVTENRDRILRVCRVYAWNSADQDDLYQEILLQVWGGLPGLKEDQFANTWLYRVAINTAMSFVRKRASCLDRVVHFEHANLRRTVEARQATEDNTDDRIADLYTAIYKLGPLEKALVTLFLEGFTYEQMAEATGISANNVGVMLHRAKKKLSGLMLEETPQ